LAAEAEAAAGSGGLRSVGGVAVVVVDLTSSNAMEKIRVPDVGLSVFDPSVEGRVTG
jgi:hypothetical protein